MNLSLKSAFAALALVALSASGGCAQARMHPRLAPVAQRLATERLTVFAAAAPAHFTVEVAADDATREKGLMFRRAMRDDQGMIFDFVQPQPTAFWMRNTYIPLDLLFVAADGRIVNIARQAKPMDESPIPSAGPIRAVIEINGGLADKLGFKPGDRVQDARVFPNG